MQHVTINRWLRFGLLNLAIVALYGLLMRYKIAFDFPIFQQKHLLHAHSHFAFSGWISHFLYCGLAGLAFPHISNERRRKYNWIIALNLFSAYGMLVAFTMQGYKAVSISFSTLSIIISVFFAIAFISDRKRMPKDNTAVSWAIAGLLVNILSAGGPMWLAYMMATKTIQPHLYLSSVYYYLHFQYSGWFFFGTMAIAIGHFNMRYGWLSKYFKVFVLTIIPTFGLSILWVKLPVWIYIIVVIATIAQMIAWLLMALKIWSERTPRMIAILRHPMGMFFYIAIISLSIKFCLQTVSVIPSLSQLVFGFRPIVIAYLHLVFLGVYSLFIMAYLFSKGILADTKLVRVLATLFLVGVLLNEALLGVQGFAAFAYVPIPHINEMLLVAAIVLAASAIALFLTNLKTASKTKVEERRLP